ncbi:Cation/H(+) antiporter 1 [Acorus gramineus]|uniref:Cation/H(+) antiporter 1 n=1 Tax=Acorus gramineus TaxID=55184 RepID=A0AAV9ABN8_ACOGR|nr:Cation/H(+) antiporter 1 [Acorus gramineus]
MACNEGGNIMKDMSGFIHIILQMALLLTISKILHFFLRRIGQPSAISQMLAGLLMGPSCLIRLPLYRHYIMPNINEDYLLSLATLGRMCFMFLIGLEIDLPYMLRSSRRAAIIAYGGTLPCSLLAACFSPVIYYLTNAHGSRLTFALTLMLIFSNTASPILVRMSTELKLTTSEIGRIAISAALINDMSCLTIIAITSTGATATNSTSMGFSDRATLGFTALALMAFVTLVTRPFVRWINHRNRHRHSIRNTEVVVILIFVFGVSVITEMLSYNSMMSCFILGLMFPREGGTQRTLVRKLSYPVNHVILPVYFGFIGMSTDLFVVFHARLFWTVVIIVCLNTFGKVLGTILATQYLQFPLHEGLVLGFLLNVKGHIDMIIITMARKNNIWGQEAFMVFLTTIMVNTFIAGPSSAFIVRRERRALKYMSMGLEFQKPESEVRILACVHGPRELPTMVGLIEASRGTDPTKTPLAAYVMHLVRLTQKMATTMLYHQQEDHRMDDNDEDELGGDDARQINTAIDAFTMENGITVRQVTAVSAFSNMHEDVCNGAEDVRASIIILPFHKHQRVDGKMVSGRDGVRLVNGKVLRHAPCTVGILVDRGLGTGPTAVASSSQAGAAHHNLVATLFFGGPDDREALAFASRIAMHPNISLTVVRFLPMRRGEYEAGIEMEASKDNEVLIAINNHEKEAQADEEFLSRFYDRHVATGMVSYVEKFVENGADTVTALSAMEGMYTLYLVGKGGRGISPLTMGMSEWEDCPELGSIGDLLASSDFTTTGSVLVIQQHNKTNEGDLDEDFLML